MLAEGRSLIRQRNTIEDRAVELLGNRPDYQQLRTIPGIGPINALTILAETGDLRRFHHHRQFLKFCGMDLATVQSGMFRGRSKISKYGNARLRRTLWLTGQTAVLKKAHSFRDKFERYIAQDRHNPDLRRKFGKWNSVFKRFRRWVMAGAFYRMFRALAEDAYFEYAMIDGSIVKVHRPPLGGVTTKIMALTDALGKLIDFRLLPGQAHDLRGALTEQGIVPVIPSKSNRRFPAKFDRDTCKWRHLIETFFEKLKEYRGIATRCCKTDESSGAFISIVATIIRLK